MPKPVLGDAPLHYLITMNDKAKSLLSYAAKCMTGSLITFFIAHELHYYDIAWFLISVMLVLSPDKKDAIPLAVTRIKANLVGSAIGMLALLASPSNEWSMSIALAATVTVCSVLKLETGTRSSLAATVIVMFRADNVHVWNTALERVLSVVGGCALALIITFVFHFSYKADTIESTINHDDA